MARRVFISLLVATAVMLSAGPASAAFFGVVDLGSNVFQVTLNGESGDATTTLADADIQSIEIFGATLVSQDQTTSIFQGKTLGPTNLIVSDNLFQVSGTDFSALETFSSATVFSLGNFTLSGAPTSINLTASGLFTANPGFGQPGIVISQSGGEALLPEPATLLLLGLGLAGFAFVRRQKA